LKYPKIKAFLNREPLGSKTFFPDVTRLGGFDHYSEELL
jgi:hypothetical protein